MKWVSAFKYLPINYNADVAVVKERTQRVSFDNNLNGDRVRLRFSNRYAGTPLRLDRVTVGVESDGSVRDAVPVTLGGNAVITLEPGQEVFSDEIPFPACAGERLAISIYIGAAQTVGSVCCLWSRTGARVSFSAGDRTEGPAVKEAELDKVLPVIREDPSPYKTMFFYGIDALQVYTADDVKAIVAFGDSITHMSFVTNALMKRLYAACPGRVTLINSGIGGNRLVHDATCIKAIGQVVTAFGDAGIRRFEKDVFELDTVYAVLVLIGINDIMHPIQLEGQSETTASEAIIDGYRSIAAIAHKHGAAIYGATVMPCGNDAYPTDWLPAFERTRLALNDWIRSENDLDGFFDYDAALRDEANPGYLLPGTHIGDGLHPNDRGGELVAAAVDLGRLTGWEKVQ